jgi:hypothetical protein
VTQEIQDQQDQQEPLVQLDQRAIQVIPDLLAQLDRLVQLALPEKLALLVRLGLLVLLGHKDQKAIREIQATQGQQVLLVPQDQVDQKAQQEQQVQPEPQAQQERLGLKVHRE